MIEVRTKDKVFLAVLLPVAAVAAYAYFWRAGVAKRIDLLERQHATLVAVEEFPQERRRVEARLADAEAAFEAEKAVPRPAPKVVFPPDAAFAERERAVLGVFREAGLTVLRSEAAEGGTGGEALLAVRGRRRDILPACRAYTLDGTYPAVRRALDAFAARRMAVVTERVEMLPSGAARWSLEVWL